MRDNPRNYSDEEVKELMESGKRPTASVVRLRIVDKNDIAQDFYLCIVPKSLTLTLKQLMGYGRLTEKKEAIHKV